jgi:hypothetical protein
MYEARTGGVQVLLCIVDVQVLLCSVFFVFSHLAQRKLNPVLAAKASFKYALMSGVKQTFRHLYDADIASAMPRLFAHRHKRPLATEAQSASAAAHPSGPIDRLSTPQTNPSDLQVVSTAVPVDAAASDHGDISEARPQDEEEEEEEEEEEDAYYADVDALDSDGLGADEQDQRVVCLLPGLCLYAKVANVCCCCCCSCSFMMSHIVSCCLMFLCYIWTSG